MTRNLHNFILLACFFISGFASAQNPQTKNLKVEYENLNTLPDFLNICGETDEVTVIISAAGPSIESRTNITATLDLFAGVRFVKLVPEKSTPGVSMKDTSNVNEPIFNLPDLKQIFGEITSIKITFKVSADCSFLDTLAKNNDLTVYDVWKVKYDIGTQKELIESHTTAEYRDAFAVPVFSLSVIDKFTTPKKGGDCFPRNILVTNSGLRGHVNTFTYKNIQSRGLLLRGLLVNGDPITFTKTALPNNDTLYEAKVTGTYFIKNKKGTSGGNGNGDQLFDPDEVMTITENLCVSNCNFSTFSTHSVAWGCFGKECDVKSINQTVPVGIGSPNPVFSASGSVPSKTVGYCQEATSVAVYKNEGTEVDAGFGTMYDIVASIGIGSAFQTQIKGYKINSLVIAGKTISLGSKTTVDFGKDNSFKADPDGAGGLSDEDGDGFFDDLKIGQSFEMIVKYEFICGDNDTTQLCTNERNVGVSAAIKYRSACGGESDKIDENFQNVSNNNNGFEDVSDTDAFIGINDTFYVKHTEERSMFFFEKNCGGQERFYAKIYLPKGILPALNKFGLYKNGSTSPLLMTSDTIKNDTLYLTFDGTDPFLTGKYELRMAFYATCDANVGIVRLPFDFGFYCPSCACWSPWYCNIINGPKLHGSSVCKEIACPVGLRTTSFEANRTTLGYTDATFTKKVDIKDANRKVAISCDSVEIRVKAIVGNAPISDSIGVQINYSSIIDASVPTAATGEILKFKKGRLRIRKGSQNQTCVIPENAAQFTAGMYKMLRIDLNACLAQGITLNAGDSLEFIGEFFLDPDGPYATQFKNIPNFRGQLYYRNNGIDYSCDDFGENFIVAKNRTVFDFPTNATFPKGCATSNMEYRLVTVNNGFRDFFPKEYRQAVQPDSIHIRFDPAMITAFEDLAIEYSIPGHPIFGNNAIPLAKLKDYPNGQYSVDFDSVQYRVAALNNVSYYSFLFRIKATPNCKSLTGSKDGNNRFDFDATIRYTDRYYAKEIGNGSCAIDSLVVVDNDVYYTEPASLIFNPVTNPNFDLVGDTATWTVKLCNTSVNSDAGTSWIAIENPNDKLDVVAIDEIFSNGTIRPLTVKKYGTSNSNAFAISKKLSAAGGANPADSTCSTLRIKAYVKSCGSQKIEAVAGWDCKPKPANWTPLNNAPCEDNRMDLRIVAQEPQIDAVLDEGFNKNPDLCDTVFLDLLVRNTGKAKAYNVNTKIWIPAQGATLVPGSVQIAYPSGAPFKTLAINPTNKGVSAKGILYEYSDFKNLSDFLDKNGLAGFNQLNPSDSNEFKIRYKVVTDCEFKSGALSYFAVQGEKACGEKTNLETGESKPIRIKGAIIANDQRIFDINITGNTIVIPTLVSTIELAVVNTTSFISDTTDKMSIKLPVGFIYKSGSAKGLLPSGYNPGEPTIEIENGQQVLTFPIATGLGLQDSSLISVQATSPNFDCVNPPLFEANIETKVTRAVKCLSNPNAEPCIIDVITSTGGSELVELPVRYEGAMAVNFDKVTSKCAANGTEIITAIGTIQNLDTIPFPDFPIEITYFFDADGNGLLDSTENIIKQFMMQGPLDTMETKPFNHVFTANAKEICLIRAKINAEGSACNQYTYGLPTPALFNAGEDKGVCVFVGDEVSGTIGDKDCSNPDYTYSWVALEGLDAADILEDTDVSNPTYKFNWTTNFPDTITLVLETNRGTFCDASRDTVLLFRNNANIPEAKISISPNKLCAGGEATLTGSGGVEFVWTDASGTVLGNSNILKISPKQTTVYSLKITDTGGCKDTTSIRVTPLPTPVVKASPDVTICLLNMTTLKAEVTGGTNFIYNWTPTLGLDNPTLATPSAKPGATTVYKVEAIDANGCVGADEVRVQVDTCAKCIPPMIDVIQIKKPVCGVADRTGSIQLYLWGGNHKDYDYKWTPDIGKTDDFGAAKFELTSGIYTVKINPKKDTACSKVFKFVVTAACVGDANITINGTTSTTCATSNNGAVSFSINYSSDFKGPADTIITDGIKEYVNGQLPAGDYYIAVKGKMGCLAGAVPFKITAKTNDAVQILATVTDRCDSLKQSGGIAVIAAGGSGNYTFDWSDLAGTNDPKDRTDLKEGKYSLLVSDSNGCSALKADLEVKRCVGDKDDNDDDNSTPSFNTTFTVSNLKCFGELTGTINFTIKGEATLVAKTKTFVTKTGSDFYENGKLGASDYLLILTDENAKPLDTISFTIQQPDAIVLGVKVDKVCNNQNGAITITVNGGIAPFNYDWADIAGSNNAKDRTDLSVGNYALTVQDANGCSASLNNIAITKCDSTSGNGNNNPSFNVAFTTTNLKCFNDANGSINFSINGDSSLVKNTKTLITQSGTELFENGKLKAGSYLLILTDANAKALDTIGFTITQPNALALAATTEKVCNGKNGAISLAINGGIAPYIYDWADLAGTNDPKDRANISEGNYAVTVTDSNGCSRSDSNIFVTKCDSTNNGGGLSLNINIKIQQPKCVGDANGSISFTINGDSTKIATAKTFITKIWTDRYENGKLAAGDYFLVLTDASDKPLDTLGFTIQNPLPLTVTYTVKDVCKGILGEITLQVSGGTEPYKYDWADVFTADDPKDRTFLTPFDYNVTVTDANGCTNVQKNIKVSFCIDSANVALCNFFAKDTMDVYLKNCDDIATVCLPMKNPDSFYVFINGAEIPSPVCSGKLYSFVNIKNTGSFKVLDWNGKTATVANFDHLKDSLQAWDPAGKWEIDNFAKQISTFGNNPTLYPNLNLQFNVNNIPITYSLNFMNGSPGIYTNLFKGESLIYVEKINDPSCFDSIRINVRCDQIPLKNDTIYLTMFINEMKQACLDISELKAPVATTQQGCSSKYIADAMVLANNCINFKGVNLGKDTICFTFCDQQGICDVTYVILDVNKPFTDVYDSLYVGEFKVYCINYEDYGFEGAVEVTSTCEAQLKNNITHQFDPQSPKCIEYGGVKVGFDTICLTVCEKATNRCSDFKIIVKVLPTKLKSVYRDTIFVDSTATYCFKSNNLQTKPASIVNLCPDKSGTDVQFTLDATSFCATYKGLKVGVDTACVSICDSIGNCFDIEMQVWVNVFIDPPLARDDIDTAFIDKTLVIDEMANDVINGKLMEMELISKPRLGLLTMTLDKKIQYLATDEKYCTQIDSFSYYICNQDGCDSAMVKIYIRCPKVKVYNGVSSNEDGTNDTFIIDDIDLFPNNEVKVYNRWGNEVFFKKGYKNEWKGDWNGRPLPDGTYYYIIELNDEERTMLSGYLQIHR
jgi:gliding motility-associated-like protein